MKTFFCCLLILFSLYLPAQLKQTTTQALLKVEVVDNKNIAQPKQQITFIGAKDNKEYTGITDATGKFSILIPPAQKYQVKYKIFNTTKDALSLDMPVAETPYTVEYTITVTPPRTFRLDNVFFDSGKSTLRKESDKELADLIEYMKLKKTLVIEIAGHTDNVGSPDANQKLSEDRANAVKQYLVKNGIEAARIQARGYGDTQPVADNITDKGKQQNRRTEVHIVTE